MDKLEAEIQAKLKEAEVLRKKAEIAAAKAEQAEYEARILQRAADLRPADGMDVITNLLTFGPGTHGSKRGGRQPGSISMKWREVLAELATEDTPFNIDGLVLVANRRSLELGDRGARERVRRYLEQGFLEDCGNGRYRVSKAAVLKFKLFE